MTPQHFQIFQGLAQEIGLMLIVRNTNRKSTRWIEQGYPAKPKSIECHTSEKTGKVTAKDATEIAACRAAGFYVIDKDGIARRGPNESLPQKFLFGTPEMNEAGQVIDPVRKRALVGDYDLMGVIDPQAPGRNLILIASNGIRMCNLTNPEVEKVRTELNRRLDQPRVMHGAQDQFGDFPEKGGSTAFLPNGLVWELKDPESVRGFYAMIRRQPIVGSYGKNLN